MIINDNALTLGVTAVAEGGTGRDELTAGSYLVGNGTEAVILKTPQEVLADLDLATETWTFTLEDGSTVTKEVYVG